MNNEKMNDNELVTDMLSSHKALMQLYCTSLIESSCPNQRKLYIELLTMCSQDQFKLFEYMETNGLYPIEDAPNQKVTEAQNKFGTLQKTME